MTEMNARCSLSINGNMGRKMERCCRENGQIKWQMD